MACMTISYEPQRQDVESAVRGTTMRALRPMRYFVVAFAALFACAFLLTIWTHSGENRGYLLQSARPMLYLALFFIILFWLSPKLSARKVILRPTRWTFDDAGATLENEVASAQIRWPAFQKYIETRREFLLYVQKNQAHFIPKRVLSEEQQTGLRELLARHLKH